MIFRLLILSTLTAQLFAANLIENSSFEAGDLHGWSFGGATFQVKTPFYVTNSAGWHGGKGVRMENVATNTNPNTIVSRAYQLKTNTTYTVSMYARKDVGAGTVHVYLFPSNIDAVREGDGWETHKGAGWALTTSWARYSNTFTTHTNPAACSYMIYLKTHYEGVNGGAIGDFWDSDAVQLEEGSSATAYAPMSEIEIGANLVRGKAGHVFYSTDTLSLDFTGFNNTGSEATRTLTYHVRDIWNTLQKTGALSMTISAGASLTNSATITGLPLGWFRATYWLTNQAGSLNDLPFSRVLTPVSVSHRTNRIFGLHLPNQPWFLDSARRIGVGWNRLFSVERWGRWGDVNYTEGTFLSNTGSVALNRTYDIEPLLQIIATENRNSWEDPKPPMIPDWATNSVNGWPLTNKLYTFVTNVGTVYKDHVDYYEILNEMAYQATNQSKYPDALEWSRRALTDSDPGSKVVAFADFYTVYGKQIIDITGPEDLDIWSFHSYEYSSSGDDTLWTYHRTNFANYPQFSVWMTEAGKRTETATKANFTELRFTPNGAIYPDNDGYLRDARYRLAEHIHAFAYAFRGPVSKWFHYDARNVAGLDNAILYSVFDQDQTMRPMGVMMAAIAQRLETAVARGRVSIHAKADSFWYDRAGLASVLLYSTNQDNIPLPLGEEGSGGGTGAPPLKLVSSLATNQFAIYDLFGNQQNYPAGGYPFGLDAIWIEAVSGTTTNQLLSSLSISTDTDTVAPNLQIITYPLSTYSGPYLFRWNAVDNASLDVRWNGQKGVASYTVNTNALRFRSRLAPAEGSYGSWTNTSWRYVNSMTWDENATLYVQAIDAAGNTTTERVSLFTSTPQGAGNTEVGRVRKTNGRRR